jgi:predicted regulator of Ras-like GTPase activity (Roadblock/LC7/MglB family)
MATKFLTHIDLNQNQLVNATLQQVPSDPASGNFEGRLIYHTGEDVIKVWSGTAWRTLLASTGQGAVGTNGVISGGANATAITISETNGQTTITPVLATSSIAGLLTAADFTKLADATAEATFSKLVIRDASGQAKVADPTLAAHIATKGYVDSARQGLDVKQSVRVATTGAINLTTDLNNGDTIDGVTLVTGDRVLVKDQATASQNGIYVAVASGAASRSSDANGTADTGELTSGTFVFVEAGTINFDSGFVISTDGTITVGTTGITWTQFSGAGSFDAGNGLSKTGTQVNVNVVTDRTAITGDAVDIASTYAGQSSITTLGTIGNGTWAATDVAVAHGGTNASTESGARTNLASASGEATGRTTDGSPTLARTAHQACAATNVGSTSVTTVTHNFGTKHVIVQVYQVSTGETVNCDVVRGTNDSLSVTINGASIGADEFHIVVTG